MAQHGALSIVTTDDDAAAANIQITADGTAELAGTTVTLDSGANVVLSPAAGSHVKIDDVIQVDSGVVTGATSITSTNFVGIIDGALGSVTPAAVIGTTITANTGIVPDANDGAYLGQAGTAFSDLFLAEGGVINWDSGDLSLTQAGDVLTLGGDGSPTLTATLTNALSITAAGGIGMTSYDASAAVTDLALDIDGMTDIGAAIASGDLIIVDDGAGGTNRKSTIDRVASKFAGTGLSAASAVIGVDAAQAGITSIYNTGLKVGYDASDNICFATGSDGQISYYQNGIEEFRMAAGGTFHADADVVAYSSTVASDMNLKENITDMKYGLADIVKLRGVEYDWKRDDMGHDVGVLAQEVEAVIPELVKEHDGLHGRGKFKSVDYNKLVPVLIESIKELKLKLDEQDAIIRDITERELEAK